MLTLCNGGEANEDSTIGGRPSRVPWNKGKLIGAKPPLRAKQVWSIRTKLQVEGRTRDLAMFHRAIDSKLRGCDVVSLRFELTEQTREAVDAYIRAAGKKPGQLLFAGRRGSATAMSTRQYARLVSKWVAGIGLDPSFFVTHSLRRTKATLA